MRQFELELSGDPTNANAAYELGEIHRKAGEMEMARRLFEQAVESYPAFEQAQIALGGVLTSLGQPELALAHLRTAIAINGRNHVSHYRLAQAHRALGETAEMRKALQTYQSAAVVASTRVRGGSLERTGDSAAGHTGRGSIEPWPRRRAAEFRPDNLPSVRPYN